jgi:hypothetical protein
MIVCGCELDSPTLCRQSPGQLSRIVRYAAAPNLLDHEQSTLHLKIFLPLRWPEPSLLNLAI